jgi:hypothetical protein
MAARGLMSIGRERGWVTPNGTLVPPGTEPPSGKVKAAESIPHESVCLHVHLPRHPADADVEQGGETLRDFVQLSEMCLSHRGDTIYLVHDELRVHVDPDSLNPVIAGKLQSLDKAVSCPVRSCMTPSEPPTP